MTADRYSRLLEQFGGDPNLLREVTEAFLEQAADLMPRILSAIASRDTAKARLWAHTLKGSVRVFGCETCGDAAERLETALGSGSTDAPALAEVLRRELTKLTEQLAGR